MPRDASRPDFGHSNEPLCIPSTPVIDVQTINTGRSLEGSRATMQWQQRQKPERGGPPHQPCRLPALSPYSARVAFSVVVRTSCWLA